MAAGWQRAGAMASADAVARPSQPSAFPHRPYGADYGPSFATAGRRWHPWETSQPQDNASHRNESANPPPQSTTSAVYEAESSVRTQPHVVDVDHNTDHRSESREAHDSNQHAREATPVMVFGGPERYDRAPGDLLRREEHCDAHTHSPVPSHPAVLPPPELYSRTPDEDVFDASVRFRWLVILAVNIVVAVGFAVLIAAHGSLGTALLLTLVAIVSGLTLLTLPYVSVTRIHVERVTTAGTNNAPYSGGGTVGPGDHLHAGNKNRCVRVVSYRLPCLCRTEHELRECDVTHISVNLLSRDMDRRKACCHDVVYAHVAATSGEGPWQFPVYVGTSADEQAELWRHYLGFPPHGTV